MDGIWEVLGQPDGFTVIEAGAGCGTLARAVIAAKPRCLETGTYLMVERSTVLRADHPVGAGLASSVHLPKEEITGVLIANELLDNLGFGLLAADGEKWREVQVGLDSGRLVPEQLDPATDIARVQRIMFSRRSVSYTHLTLPTKA